MANPLRGEVLNLYKNVSKYVASFVNVIWHRLFRNI